MADPGLPEYGYTFINIDDGLDKHRLSALKSILTPEIEERMLAHTPIKRLDKAEDIAGAMLYFASPVSEWVSGQTLFVNGGRVQTLD